MNNFLIFFFPGLSAGWGDLSFEAAHAIDPGGYDAKKRIFNSAIESKRPSAM